MIKQEINCPHKLPISECLEHWIVFCEQTNNTPISRAVKWALSNDTGSSSKALCATMLGFEPLHKSAPWDAADRGRCIRLLRLIPEWIPRLDEMAKRYPSTAAVEWRADGKHTTLNGWAEQIPLIIKEGGF